MTGPGRRTQRLIYGGTSADELPILTRVDQAHVVMLAGRGLIRPAAARDLLRAIGHLVGTGFADLHGRPAPRGHYLMYENYLIETLGPDVGGVLHTGRSRNDLKATVTALRLRSWLLDFAEQASRLEAVLLSRACRYRDVVMPIYTHFQAAMPVTYGHYLLGVALAAGREIDSLRAGADGLAVCPLGASAVAGTDLPIDPAHTARLLGFTAASRHALDAVASRDVPLRLLAAAAGLTVTLSRLATDLQLWSTVEFGFVRFPDRLVGGSSAMPQKRNAFLLEHVKAKPGRALGAWAAAASTMSTTPFTNSIEVGTEAMASVWDGLRAAEDAVLLCQPLVSAARPQAQRMRDRAENGFVTATAAANRLVRGGVPFRTAHRAVGEAVRRAIAAGGTRLPGAGPDGAGAGGRPAGEPVPDLDEVVREQSYGGGPGDFTEPHRLAVAGWTGHRRWLSGWRGSLAEAGAGLDAEVRRLTR